MIHTLTLSSLALSRGERLLFRDLSLSLSPGDAIALTGSNGAGKTTLLRAIAGFIRPDAGEIAFHDADRNLIEPETARAHEVHMLGHLDGLKGARTARQELAFQAAWLANGDHELNHAIQALGLTPLLDLEVRKLSAGQRRRLAFARLLASPRALWLLDEPLSPLDARWRTIVGTMMQTHLARGGLLIAAVHDPLPFPTRPLDLGGGR